MTAENEQKQNIYQGCRLSLDYLIANEKMNRQNSKGQDSNNIYISHFCHQEWLGPLRELADRNDSIRKLLNHKTLKKEITELYGVLSSFEKSLQRSSGIWNNVNDDVGEYREESKDDNRKEMEAILKSEEDIIMMKEEEGMIQAQNLNSSRSKNSLFPILQYLDSTHQLRFYDICCGRGIASFFLSFMFPHTQIILIDSNQNIKLDHFKIPQCQHLEYYYYDIYSEEFYQFLLKHSNDSSSNLSNLTNSTRTRRLSLIFGLHLCGTLSLRLCTLYNTISSLSLLVVSPCCMPRNKKSNTTHRLHLHTWNQRKSDSQQTSGDDHIVTTGTSKEFSSYDYWCLSVYYQLDSKLLRRDMHDDEYVISEKSKYIVGSRLPPPPPPPDPPRLESY